MRYPLRRPLEEWKKGEVDPFMSTTEETPWVHPVIQFIK